MYGAHRCQKEPPEVHWITQAPVDGGSKWLRVMSDWTGLILSLQSQTDFNRVIQNAKLTFDKMCDRYALMKRKMDLSVNKTTYCLRTYARLCSHSSKHAYQQNCVCMPKENISHNTTFLNGSHSISGWKPLHFSSQIIQSQSKQFHFKINTYIGASKTFMGSLREGYRTPI